MKRPTGLARVLGIGDLSVLSSASMAPAYSIASTFGLMVAATGAAAPLALIVLTIPILFIAIAFFRLCEESPNAGATYSWSRLAFGTRFGALAAWIVVLSYFFAAVAAVVPAGIYTLSLLAPQYVDNAGAVALVGSVWVLVASALLIGGIKPTARTSGLFLLLEVAALLLFAGLAFAHPAADLRSAIAAISGRTLQTSAGGFLAAMVLAIWVTDGWEVSTYTSEENAGSSRQPGMGGIIALVATVLIMIVCALAFMHIGSLAGFSQHSGDTLAYVAGQLGGGWRTPVMVVTVLVSTAATLWTTQLGISRGMFSMARDRVMFPLRLSDVHPTFGTPHVSILAANAGVLVVTLLMGFNRTAHAALSEVINATSIFLGLTFIFTGAACVWHFVRRGVRLWDPTRVVLPTLGTIGVTALLVVNFKSQSSVDQWIALGCVALGIGYALIAPFKAKQAVDVPLRSPAG